MEDKSVEEILSYMPGHKMGVKHLSFEQMNAVFPDFERLRNKIETHREFIKSFWSKKEENLSNKLDDQYNIMFDNVYSILGSRGSGKTSVIYTMKNLFEERNPTDIVLPIIMSELIPESCEIIGWILSLLENVVQDIQKKLNNMQKDRNDYWVGCSSDRNKQNLLSDYETVKELCFSKKYNERNADSFSTAVIGSERSTQNSFDFSKRLTAFWTKLKCAVKKVRGINEDKEPLIYIIFDDVDLTPEKIWELLSTIVKYLSHPNVIVLLTAEERMLCEVVGNVLRIKTKSDENDSKANDWIKKTTRLYVGKILPPATRYYIERFETCLKRESFGSLRLKNNKIESVFLKDFLINCVEEYTLDVQCKMSNKYFLFHDEADKDFLDAYFLFWGHTSRQLENERLIIEDFFLNLKDLNAINEREKYLPKLYHVVYNFVFSTLHANSMFHDMNANEWADNLFEYHPQDWGVYINYAYIMKKFLEIYETKDDSENDAHINKIMRTVKQSIAIYLLLFFVENILLIEYDKHQNILKQKREKVHGKVYLVEMLDMITHDSESLVCGSDVGKHMQDFLYVYGGILEHPEILLNFDIRNASTVREYFYMLPRKADISKGVNLNYYDKVSPKWFKTMTKLLFMSDCGIYKLTPSIMRELQINRKQRLLDITIQMLEQDMLSNIAKCISENIKLKKLDKPGKEINLKDCSTEKLYNEVSKRVEQDCLTTVGKLNRPLFAKLDLYFRQMKYADLLEELKKQINELYGKYDNYYIEKKEDFDQNIKISRDMANLQFDLSICQNRKVPIPYMNSYMNRLIKKSFDIEGSNAESFLFDGDEYILRREKLQYYYDCIKGCLTVDLNNTMDKENMLQLLVLRKLYNYAEIQFIQDYMEKSTKGDFAVVDTKRIPYVNFTKMIKEVVQKKDTKKGYINKLVAEYIKEGVDDYIEYIYHRRLE